MSENIRKNFRITIKKKFLLTFYSKNQAVNVVLLKTKATVKLVYRKWRILGICCIFLYFQLQIRALYVDFETHVFIRFLISIKFSIIISHKKRGGRKSSSAREGFGGSWGIMTSTTQNYLAFELVSS